MNVISIPMVNSKPSALAWRNLTRENHSLLKIYCFVLDYLLFTYILINKYVITFMLRSIKIDKNSISYIKFYTILSK